MRAHDSDDEPHEAKRQTGSVGDVSVSYERTKGVFVLGAAAVLLGGFVIWWYVKRPWST